MEVLLIFPKSKDVYKRQHLAGHQAPLGRRSFLVRRLPGEAHGRDAVVVKIAAHKFRVIDRHAEAEALHLVNVRHI